LATFRDISFFTLSRSGEGGLESIAVGLDAVTKLKKLKRERWTAGCSYYYR